MKKRYSPPHLYLKEGRGKEGCFTSDGKMLAICSAPSLWIYDPATATRGNIKPPEGFVFKRCLPLSDGKLAILLGKKDVSNLGPRPYYITLHIFSQDRLWAMRERTMDTAVSERNLRFLPKKVETLCFSKNGEYYAYIEEKPSREVVVCNTATAIPTKSFPLPRPFPLEGKKRGLSPGSSFSRFHDLKIQPHGEEGFVIYGREHNSEEGEISLFVLRLSSQLPAWMEKMIGGLPSPMGMLPFGKGKDASA